MSPWPLPQGPEAGKCRSVGLVHQQQQKAQFFALMSWFDVLQEQVGYLTRALRRAGSQVFVMTSMELQVPRVSCSTCCCSLCREACNGSLMEYQMFQQRRAGAQMLLARCGSSRASMCLLQELHSVVGGGFAGVPQSSFWLVSISVIVNKRFRAVITKREKRVGVVLAYTPRRRYVGCFCKVLLSIFGGFGALELNSHLRLVSLSTRSLNAPKMFFSPTVPYTIAQEHSKMRSIRCFQCLPLRPQSRARAIIDC